MADEKILITVDVDTQKMQNELSGAIHVVQAMKEEQARLRKEIVSGNDVNGEYARQLVQVSTRLEQAQRQVKSQTAVLQAATAEGIKQNASLDEQRQYLGQLQKAYASLSGEEKAAADKTGGMRDQIKALNDSLVEQEHNIGENGRNVGNYSESILKAIPGFDKFNAGLSSMGVSVKDFAAKGMGAFKQVGASVVQFGKTLLTTPIGWIAAAVGAVVAVFNKLKEAIGKNDEAGTKLSKTLASFQPILNIINKIFNKVAEVMVDVFAKATDVVISAIRKVIETAQSVANAFGADVNWTAAFDAQKKDAQDLIVLMDALQDKERQYAETAARLSKEVSELRTQSEDTKDPKARIELLQQAMDKEKEMLEGRKEIAEEKLKLAKIEAAEELGITLEEYEKQEQIAENALKNHVHIENKYMSRLSDEQKDKISNLKAELYTADKEYYDGSRRLQKEMISAQNEIVSKQKEAAEKRKKQREEELKEAKETAKAEKKALQDLEDFRASRIKDDTERELKEKRIAGEREIEDLRERLETEKNLTAEARESLNELIKEKEKALKEDLTEITREAEEEKLAARKEAREEFGLDPEKTPEEQEMEMLETAREEDLLNAEEYEAAKALIHQKYLDQQTEETEAAVKKATELYQQEVKKTGSAVAGAMSALSDLCGEYADSSEDAAAAQKAFALGSILINQAMSIAEGAKGIAAAMAGAAEAAAATGPAAPIMLAVYQAQMVGQVLAVVASVASSIVQAKQLFDQSSSSDSGSYATGGIIPGTSYSGDNLTANVNSGEMILNKDQQTRLFDIANGGGPTGYNYEAMATAVAAGMAAAPAPQLALKELADAQSRVTTYNEIAKI